jgi:hypothetical protein
VPGPSLSSPPVARAARARRHRIGRKVALVAGGLALALALLTSPASGQEPECTRWSGKPSLQLAVNAYPCVEIQPGRYELPTYLVVPDGHRLVGNPRVPRSNMMLRPAASWVSNGYEAVVMGNQPPHGAQAQVAHFVVDAAGIATGGLGGANMRIDDMVVRNGRCWGVAVVGDAMSVTRSLIERNGADPTCPSAPGAGIYAAANGLPHANYAPSIIGNTIRDNVGPALDVYNVWNGQFVGNRVSRNSNWAGVSLVGSYWLIADNTIDQPASETGQPWVPPCNRGPAGTHSAAIVLCQATIAGGVATTGNVITGNTVWGWYGILLIGNDEANRLAVPRANSIAQTTFRPGVTVRCADDHPAGRPDSNAWSGCQPTPF